MILFPQATCIDAALYVYFMAHGLEVYKKYKRVEGFIFWKLAKNKDTSSVRQGSWFVLWVLGVSS